MALLLLRLLMLHRNLGTHTPDSADAGQKSERGERIAAAEAE
jgi:hypothetical protein